MARENTTLVVVTCAQAIHYCTCRQHVLRGSANQCSQTCPSPSGFLRLCFLPNIAPFRDSSSITDSPDSLSSFQRIQTQPAKNLERSLPRKLVLSSLRLFSKVPTAEFGMDALGRVWLHGTINNTTTKSAASTEVHFSCSSGHPCDSCNALRKGLEAVRNVHDATQQIKKHLECMRTNQAFLKDAIRKYSNAIIARWKKRSQTK